MGLGVVQGGWQGWGFYLSRWVIHCYKEGLRYYQVEESSSTLAAAWHQGMVLEDKEVNG